MSETFAGVPAGFGATIVERSAVNRPSRTGRRACDVLISLGLLWVALPVMLVVALMIKFDSAGPVFYRQRRVGLHGQVFTLLKFRSMRTDAEGDRQPRWAMEEDPRVTAVGRFLRTRRIDELPQFINVLRGEMSLIGPRP